MKLMHRPFVVVVIVVDAAGLCLLVCFECVVYIVFTMHIHGFECAQCTVRAMFFHFVFQNIFERKPLG